MCATSERFDSIMGSLVREKVKGWVGFPAVLSLFLWVLAAALVIKLRCFDVPFDSVCVCVGGGGYLCQTGE